MSIPGSASPLFFTAAADAAAAGPIKSVRFNEPDSAVLARTPSSSSNRKTFTYSAWIKRAADSGTNFLFVAGSTDAHAIYMNGVGGSATLVVSRYVGGFTYYIETTAAFRDPAAWYHIVVAYDTTQSTASNRVKIYVNGVQITDFSSASYPAQNSEYEVNSTSEHRVGKGCDMYFADVHLIDGSALDPTSFGAYDDNGVWQAAAYSGGSFGTNGFHLFDFANESGIGNDSSGNDNDFTVNNISSTAGAGNDVLFDVPTNGTQSDTGAGGEVSGNYCTMNPLRAGNPTNPHILSNGNLDIEEPTSAAWSSAYGTFAASSGKWYWEQTCGAGSYNIMAGIGNELAQVNNYPADVHSLGYDFVDGNIYTGISGLSGAHGATLAAGDVMGVALDVDAGTVDFYKNGSKQGSTLTHNITGFVGPLVSSYDTASTMNFGQRAFAYSAPSGYKALCTTNLPDPTIADGSDHFEAVLWTGDGTNNRKISTPFGPDWVWVKDRGNAYSHRLFDTVRGDDNGLVSNSTAAEGTVSLGMESDGFVVEGSSSYNDNTDSYVAWTWDAGSSTVSNTDGTITSSVRANQTAGFSIISYTGNGTAGSTIGHGLNAAPEFVICKRRDSAEDWWVGHVSPGWAQGAYLQATDAFSSLSGFWNNTAPTNSVITLGTYPNTNTGTYICYAFAPVAGYSAFGSWEANSSSDGPFAYTGFRSRFILMKHADISYNWLIWDTARSPENAMTRVLFPSGNDAEAEGAGYSLDVTSNGFKVRNTFYQNQTMLYIAFAENPFSSNGGLAR